MSDLLDRMREAVTIERWYCDYGILQREDKQLVNDARLKSLMEMVIADERERCVQLAKLELLDLLEDPTKSCIFEWNRAIESVIEAIRKAEGG